MRLAIIKKVHLPEADKENCRIMLLKRSKTADCLGLPELAVPVDGGFEEPHCQCLDESRG